jgi:MFS transporter, DHA1 family, inner membrane transport protein
VSNLVQAEVLGELRESRMATFRAGMGVTLALAATLQAIGFGSQNLSPVLIEALRQGRGLSEGLAGLVQTIELVMTALTAFALASFATKMPPRRLALIGAVIAAASHMLSSIAEAFPLLLLLRASAGVGAALCLCAANVVLSAQREPDRIYAVGLAISSVAGIAVLPLLVYVGSLSDGWGVYAADGVWVLLLLPLVALLPAKVPERDPSRMSAAGGRLSVQMALPLAAIAIFTMFSVGLWSFAGVVAEAANVTTQLFGTTLAVGTALCVVGAWLASAIGTRFGRLLPMLVGMIGTMVSSVVFFSAKDPLVFAASFVAVQSIYAFALPFLFGFCSAVDKSGKLATTASSAILISAALAPALIGFLIQSGGLSLLISAMVVGYSLAGVAMYFSTLLLSETP